MFTGVSEVLAASIIRAIALMLEAARTSETLVNIYQTTRLYSPQYSHFYTDIISLNNIDNWSL
jgi:hypothetical protein